MLCTTLAELLDAVGDAPVGKPPQPVERERWARAIANQSLATEIVVARDGDARVQVEAGEVDRALVARRRLHAAAAMLGVGVIAKRAHGPTLHRDRGAGVERRLRAWLLQAERDERHEDERRDEAGGHGREP